MFLTKYNQEKVLEKERREVEYKTNERVAIDMLVGGEPLEKIAKYSRLEENKIRTLADALNLTL